LLLFEFCANCPIHRLEQLAGDWHEFESKALRRENEKREKEARRAQRIEEHEREKAKRRASQMLPAGSGESGREVKRIKADVEVEDGDGDGDAPMDLGFDGAGDGEVEVKMKSGETGGDGA
jgi:hypothetical protein